MRRSSYFRLGDHSDFSGAMMFRPGSKQQERVSQVRVICKKGQAKEEPAQKPSGKKD